jgi:hypothetical protein
MSTATYELPRRRARRIWPALRSAQALLLLPLGALQLLAVLVFGVTGDLSATGYLVAAWAAAMAVAGIALGLVLPWRTERIREAVRVLLLAQVAFAALKLTVYGEPAALVFLAVAGLTGLLVKLDTKLHPSVL